MLKPVGVTFWQVLLLSSILDLLFAFLRHTTLFPSHHLQVNLLSRGGLDRELMIGALSVALSTFQGLLIVVVKDK